MADFSPNEAFQLPVGIDMSAAFLFGVTGSLIAMKRGYDFVGLFSLGFVSALGGGMIRDAFLIHSGTPVAIADSRYFWLILAACVTGSFLGDRIHRWARFVAAIDAMGLAAYAVVGAERSLLAGLPPSAALMIGVVNACGGGVMRDVLVREEPLLFQPGQFYAMAAVAGATAFVALTVHFHVHPTTAAILAMMLTFAVRMLAITFNWKTKVFRWGAPVVPVNTSVSSAANLASLEKGAAASDAPAASILELAPPSATQTLFQASLSSLVPPPGIAPEPVQPEPASPNGAAPTISNGESLAMPISGPVSGSEPNETQADRTPQGQQFV